MNRVVELLIVALVAFALPGCSNPFALPPDMQEDARLFELEEEAENLSAAEAQALEDRLKQNPEDVDTRFKLIIYEFHRRGNTEDFANPNNEHAIWLIKNVPDALVTSQGLMYSQIDEFSDPEGYANAKFLWLSHLERDPKNLTLMANAAKFFMVDDDGLAVELFEKLQEAEPQNADWPTSLGDALSFQAKSDSPETNRATAQTALEAYERAAELIQSGKSTDERSEMMPGVPFGALSRLMNAMMPDGIIPDLTDTWHLLPGLMNSAFEAGELEKATEYAEKMLSTKSGDLFYEDSHHDGNTMLGRIALVTGDIEEAKKRLIDSTALTDPMSMQFLMPNTRFASELLDAGETAIVLEYLERINEFSDYPNLDTWIEEMKAGTPPEFVSY